MAKKVFTSESFTTLLSTIKTYIDNIAATKAASGHTHTVANVTNLQESLDDKAASSHTHTAANITDLTATVDELNYMSGVTSNVQTQIDGKANSSHNHSASNITSGTLSSDRLSTVPVAKGGTGATTAAGALTNLGVTATASEINTLDGITATTAEINYVNGVTSNIQTQLNGKLSTTGKAVSAVTADSATNVAWSGVTSKPSYYDAKAIKGITRNGTTFTYTCMDGTTGTFTQQDNNTTYSAVTTSANGLMIASDKAKLDGMVLATVSEVETYLGI